MGPMDINDAIHWQGHIISMVSLSKNTESKSKHEETPVKSKNEGPFTKLNKEYCSVFYKKKCQVKKTKAEKLFQIKGNKEDMIVQYSIWSRTAGWSGGKLAYN